MQHQASQKQFEVVQSMRSLRTGSRSQRWKQIKCLCDAIAQEFHPEKIVLFGSYAYGEPHPDSDVDLLVVMPFEGSPFRQAAVILSHVVRTVGVLPMDLLVRTAEQVQERLHMGDSFMREIIEHGKVMHSHVASDVEGFHAQQCVGKYLKASLEEADISFGRTHDLLVLHQLVLPLEPGWTVLQPLLIFLNPFAVAYRYPGMTATKADAKEALRNCREVRRIIRMGFGLLV